MKCSSINTYLFIRASKDKGRSIYMVQIVVEYSILLSEKQRLSIYYSNYFEGNYSLNPFFNNMVKQYKPLTIGLLENLMRFWDISLKYSQLLFHENSLIRIQFSLGLSIIDEIYCLLSLFCHLLYAFKHSTNYLDITLQNTEYLKIKEKILLIEDQFVKNYTSTAAFF